MKKKKQKEQKIQTIVSDHINSRHPDAEFFCDVAAGLFLPIWVAVLVKRWRSKSKFPDMYIFEPRGQWNMLQLELKTEESDPYKVNGELKKNKHTEGQDAMHAKMCNKGYLSLFSIGHVHAIAIVDWYLAGADGDPPKYIKVKELSMF